MAKKRGEEFDRERFRHHLRPHSPAERTGLENSIKAEGCRDPLVIGVLDGNRFLIDGFNRLAVCEANEVEFRTTDITFESEDAVLAWIEANARARRNQTRTERNYYIGCRYLREKKTHGGGRKGQAIKGKKVPVEDSTAATIAAQEKCSDKHVKNCAKLATQIDHACSTGLDFIKWPILTEQIKYTKRLLDELIYIGAGGCQEAIEAALAENSDKPLTASVIFKLLGLADDDSSSTPTIARVQQSMDSYLAWASTPTQIADLILSLKSMEAECNRKLDEVKNGCDT